MLTISLTLRHRHCTIWYLPRNKFKIQDNDANNFGNVNGQLWNDRNINGLVDLGEQVLSGWTVFLDKNRNGRLDSGEDSVITTSSGWYLLKDWSQEHMTL